MAAPPPNEPLNLETIGNLVRHWVHYDNAAMDINKQLRNLRDLKHTYEAQILQILQRSSMKQPVIQIGGGRLLVGEDKSHQPFSFTMLETMLDSYYTSKPGSRNETKDILKFIREHRTSQSAPCLKRQMDKKTRSNDKA